MEKYFFEIPIFRCDRQTFKQNIEDDVKKLIKYFKSGNEGIEFDYDALARKSVMDKLSGYRYGELVGMIRLLIFSSNQIRGEIYFINQKISKTLKHKTWSTKHSKLFEIWLHEKETNKSIYNRILKKIEDCQCESERLSKCYIDKTCFSLAGEHIDYLAMTTSHDKN